MNYNNKENARNIRRDTKFSYFIKNYNNEKNARIIRVNHLLVNGVFNEEIVNAFIKYSRQFFLPEEFVYLAESDGIISYQQDRFMIDMASLAYMIYLAKLEKTDKVLVVGSGLGYSCAIISEFVEKVIALEEDEILLAKSKDNLSKLRIKNINFVLSKLTSPEIKNTFNKVIVEGAVSSFDFDLFTRLPKNVEIITIERNNNLSQITTLVNVDGCLVKKSHKNVAIPYLLGFEKKKKFIF